jgi:hypothetical protein
VWRLWVFITSTIGGRVRSGEHARGRTASRTVAADGSQQSSQQSPELGGSPDLLGGSSAGSVVAPVNLANGDGAAATPEVLKHTFPPASVTVSLGDETFKAANAKMVADSKVGDLFAEDVEVGPSLSCCSTVPSTVIAGEIAIRTSRFSVRLRLCQSFQCVSSILDSFLKFCRCFCARIDCLHLRPRAVESQ